MRQKLTLLIVLMITPLLMAASSYNYSYWGEVIHSAPGMTFATYVDAEQLGVSLASPEDLVVYQDDIFMVDSGTHMLYVIDETFQLKDAKSSFNFTQSYLDAEDINQINPLTLNTPSGVDVTDSGIFIADTGNYRIVKLNHDFEVIDIFDYIEDDTFLAPRESATEGNEDKIYFEPKKITVDVTDRMYVIAKNVYEGILEINYDGSFNRYTGVNPIKLTPFEIFSRSLMTEEQLAQLQLFLPTEYTNASIDDRNFIYATSKVSENNAENPIQLINPKGVDVIKRNGYFPPMGDVQYIEGSNSYVIEGPSTLVDIASTKDGIYTVLDQKRSRLFTYDSEGNLLYIDGDEGKQVDKFSEGVAIGYFKDDLLVLDRKTKTIIVYRLTEFGAYVNEAIHYHNEGMFEEAAQVWKKVVKMNSNYEIAYNGIGKLLLRQEKFKEAMEYFKLGHDQYYYSKAYKEYRNAILKDNFGIIMGSIVFVSGTFIGLKIRSTYKKGGSILYED
ncbi:MAG: hypothetical protein K9L26_02225 [Candidatus Izimaplasma sp.]|nr:hypothetical protein [Candidatus Izimaplasma bacterium]